MPTAARSSFVFAVLLSLFCHVNFVDAEEAEDRSQERNEFRERIQDLAQQASHAMRSGNHEKARDLQQQIRGLLHEQSEAFQNRHATARHEPDPERREMMIRIGEFARESHQLRTAGNHEEAGELRAEIQELAEELHKRSHHKNRQVPEEKKIHHLHQAAENLEAGGFHEEAKEIHERAERMQRELERHREELHEHDHHEHEHPEAHLEQMQREVHQQLQNMRRSMQQMENQMRNMQRELANVKRELAEKHRPVAPKVIPHTPKLRFHAPGGTLRSLPPRKALGKPGRTLPFQPKSLKEQNEPLKSSQSKEVKPKPPAKKRQRKTKQKGAESKNKTKEVVLSIHSMKFMLDLDSGETMDPPQTYRPAQKKMDIAPSQVQSVEQPTALVGLRLLGFKVKSEDWDLSENNLHKKLNVYPLTQLTKLKFDETQPATFLFRTNDGSEGILQLSELVDTPKGIRIRYRSIEK